MQYHYNYIKRTIEDFFSELLPKLKDGKPVAKMRVWPDGKKRPNQEYEIKVIETQNQKELSEFADKKLNEYLNPGPTDIPITAGPFVVEILKDNAINKDRRTPEMFYKEQIEIAKTRQNYFLDSPTLDYHTKTEHLNYWSILQDWIQYLESRLLRLQSKAKAGQPEPKELVELFEKISRYKFIMNVLSEKLLVQENTGIWKDEQKGNKAHLIAIMKDLKLKGYYKKGIKITNAVYRSISNNTFQCDVKMDHIRKTKPAQFDTSFIPIATTLP